MKTIIIGAGLSGLSLAYHMEKQNNRDYLLLEGSGEIGGLCKSIRKEGFTFDFGPHMLHFVDSETNQLVQELLALELSSRIRKAGIFFNGKIVPYPFQHNLFHLDEKTKEECLNEAIKSANNFDKNKILNNFDEWIKETLGEGIANHFMRPYNKKCYCVDTKELSIDILGRHIPSPSIEEIKKGAVSDMTNTTAGYYYNFYYPTQGGIDFLPKAIAQKISNLHLNERVIEIDLEKKVVFTDKSSYSFTNLVSTISIKKLIPLIKKTPDYVQKAGENLRFNAVNAILLGINRPKISDYHFLYFPDKEMAHYRISFPMNCSEKMTPPGKSSICAEYSHLGELKMTKQEIIEKVIQDLIKAGIIQNKEEVIFKDLAELNPAYAIFDLKRKNNLEILNTFLNKKGVYTIGPFAKCEHSSMEDSIIGGRELAKRLQ